MSFTKAEMKAVAIIPARMESQRLAGKPLLKIAGKELLRWVWEAANEAKTLTQVIIATDSKQIKEEAEKWGAKVCLTPTFFINGTERIAWVARELDLSEDVIINIQGDEPLLKSDLIDDLFLKFAITLCGVGTLVTRINKVEDLISPSSVKVVMQSDNTALYFSRNPIPYSTLSPESALRTNTYWKHIGIYAYRSEVLQQFTTLPQSSLELTENLEQLRLIENGVKYFCMETKHYMHGVDTQEDLEIVEKLLKANN